MEFHNGNLDERGLANYRRASLRLNWEKRCNKAVNQWDWPAAEDVLNQVKSDAILWEQIGRQGQAEVEAKRLEVERKKLDSQGRKRNHYEALEIDPVASVAEMEEAFFRLSRQYHPLNNPNDKVAAQRYQEINAAHEVLKDPRKREAYNKTLDAAMLHLKDKGGIDLTPANLNLQTRNAGEEIKFHLDPAMLAQLQNAPGFEPVIINIQPMVDLKGFLGLQDNNLGLSQQLVSN
ncbi:MAG: DnaJ domain-containing protein [Candidatus Omnitrophota bacterium]